MALFVLDKLQSKAEGQPEGPRGLGKGEIRRGQDLPQMSRKPRTEFQRHRSSTGVTQDQAFMSWQTQEIKHTDPSQRGDTDQKRLGCSSLLVLWTS